jgi:two-component system cell cycle sensor histidine kinase/response regulator CckA
MQGMKIEKHGSIVSTKNDGCRTPGTKSGAPSVCAQLNLNCGVESCLSHIRELIGKDVDLIWRPSENPGMVRLEPIQLDRVLSSLATIARDALGGHGRLVIETDIEDDSGVNSYGDSVPSGRYIVLGMGFSGAHMLSDVSINPKQLAESSAIIKQSRGYVTTNTHPGQGSVFRILLPAGEMSDTSTAPEVTSPVRSESVLLVEDEWSIAAPIKAFLQRAGYTVSLAHSPEEAIQQLETAVQPYDLVLTDVLMPGMNGRRLYSILHEKQPSLKCIFMSGYTADTFTNVEGEESIIHFIHKPFSRDELLTVVRTVLDLR